MPSCFVVMGYGVKTDFQQNKSFDLDKAYQYIVKPAAEAAGYDCERADEIQHAGVIDVPMYERLLTADLVIADLSTANVNAFFELGVRYACKPFTTIVMAEKGFNIPFDMGHVVIRHYEHLGPGIDYGEVERMKAELTKACRAIPQTRQVDSPVYTYISSLVPPSRRPDSGALSSHAELEQEHRTQDALAKAETQEEKDALQIPLAALLAAAKAARAREDFRTMRDVLQGVRVAQGEFADPFVLQQLALAVYKSQDPDPATALRQAREILMPLDPEGSSDPETLGLWGAIHKRRWELADLSRRERLEALSTAIWAYEKGFYLKSDYYNGINFAFLLNVRAAQSDGEDAVADRVQARRVRERVLAICDRLLAEGVKGESDDTRLEEEYWIRATAAEALFGLGDPAYAVAFDTAKKLNPESWMIRSTDDQLRLLKKLLLHNVGGKPQA